jgi:hypothetical protein
MFSTISHVLIYLRTLGFGKNLNSLLLNHFRTLAAKTPRVASLVKKDPLSPLLFIRTHRKLAGLTPSFSVGALHSLSLLNL